jgi:hypothetical protein
VQGVGDIMLANPRSPYRPRIIADRIQGRASAASFETSAVPFSLLSLDKPFANIVTIFTIATPVVTTNTWVQGREV